MLDATRRYLIFCHSSIRLDACLSFAGRTINVICREPMEMFWWVADVAVGSVAAEIQSNALLVYVTADVSGRPGD